jgi:L-ascorbate metabolism protein UlaG (beta-lactamase superfamily)
VSALVALAVSSRYFASFGRRPEGARLERMKRSPRWGGAGFVNLEPTTMMRPGSTLETIRLYFGDERREPPRPVPVVARAPSDYASPPESGLRVTWIGHASAFVELGGARVLFDPIFSERCSPSTLVGPLRFHPPPITAEEIPLPDAVVISHDHYDHLDMESIRALARRGATFVVPLGIGAHLDRWGVPPGRILERDWGETATVGDLTLTALPARHYSGRLPWKQNETLWASWTAKANGKSVYFSGDTGLSAQFREIGSTYGPFDLCLLKIGAYGETWPDIHMTPEQAVEAYDRLGGGLLVPIHWGTFNLAYHAWGEPADRFVAALGKSTTKGARGYVPKPGEMVDVASPPEQATWWRP